MPAERATAQTAVATRDPKFISLTPLQSTLKMPKGQWPVYWKNGQNLGLMSFFETPEHVEENPGARAINHRIPQEAVTNSEPSGHKRHITKDIYG